jgi:hypothetical protein
VAVDSQAALQRRIAQIKAELAQLGPLRPGHLSQQYNVCGTPGCHCKTEPFRRHGPYYQISYTWQGQSRSEFVRLENLGAVQEQLRNFERLRALVEEWIGLGLVAAKLERKRTASRPKSARKLRIRPHNRASRAISDTTR